MDRRHFIKVTAATGATATLAGCGNPENQLIRFIPEEPLFPGIAAWNPSICPLCPAGCGVQVRVMAGDAEVVRNGETGILRMGLARKLEGNPEHPISQGRLCVRGQAAIQLTYHPDRIRHPLRRSGARGSGEFIEVSWEDALAEVVSRMDALAASGDRGALGFLSRPLAGQRRTLVSRFLQAFGAPPAIAFEVFGEDVLREANARSFGYRQLPTFDLAQSRYVISFGADFLGTWNSPVSHSVAYGEMRQGRPGQRAKFVQVETRMSQTGANADEWVPARPGTEGVLALGLAHVILRENLRPRSAGGRAASLIEGWSAGLPAYSPEETAKRTGVAAERIERLARELAENRPAIAIIGGTPLAHTNGMFQALAVNALNALLGSVGEPGGLVFTPQPRLGDGGPANERKLPDALDGISMLFLHDANPVFACPPSWRIEQAIAGIPYIVSFGSFIDDTSVLADLVLPDHSFLESWVDHVPETGTRMSVVSAAPPAMRPIHQTRSMPDVLLEISRRLAAPLVRELPWENYEEAVRAAFESLPASPEGEAPWTLVERQGGWWAEVASPGVSGAEPGNAPPTPITEARFGGDPSRYPFHLIPFASQAFFDGSTAHLPWLQELPDAVSTVMWGSWVEIHPGTAAGLGIAQGDLVEIVSSEGRIETRAALSPGIAPDVVAMPVGQGHKNFTRYASGRGANPLSILTELEVSGTGAPAWAATRVRIAKVAGDAAPLVTFAGGLREHEEHER